MPEPLLVWTVTVRSSSDPRHLTARLQRIAATVLGETASVSLQGCHDRNGDREGT